MILAHRRAPCALLLLALSACGKATPPPPTPQADASNAPPPVPAATASASAVATAAPVDTAAPTDAGLPGAAAADTGAPAPAPIVADNKVSPTEGQELQDRAKGLFDAIVHDEPERAEAFWFPKEPFIPLKDVKDPGKYWNQLHKSYVNDVHALHKKRKSWDGAEFVKFEGWSRTKWVPPGDEANKIGYYRAFRGKLRYKAGGQDAEMDVHTIITWQGRWYVTHLRKFKK